jgi:hypothetical protein
VTGTVRLGGLALAMTLGQIMMPPGALADALDLRLRHLPAALPTSLEMRAPAGNTGADSGDAGGVDHRSDDREPSLRERMQRVATESLLAVPRQLSRAVDKIHIHYRIGYGLDGGEPTGQPLASGATLAEGDDPSQGQFYERLRIYSFGDAVVGSRGLLLPSLSTYFAAQFRYEQQGQPIASAVPSVYDAAERGGALLVHSGHGEIDGLFSNRWLKPLFIRLGRQFRYGAAIAHFDGLTLGYDTPGFSAGVFSGQRVSLYGLEGAGANFAKLGLIAGSHVRINLHHLGRLPLAMSTSVLVFDDIQHLEGGFALRLGSDTVLRGRMRARDARLAHEHVDLRARISPVTTLHVSLDNRHLDDWAYDLVASHPDTGEEDPRRLLAFGAPLPRLRLAARAGTVLLGNLDVLLRGAAAFDMRDPDMESPSAFSASYLEGGLGFEMRFRRSLTIGSTALARRYDRADYAGPLPTTTADPLPTDTGALGERSFYQGDLSLAYTISDRRFRAFADFYGRLYREPSPLRPDIAYDLRLGGRFSVEAEVTERLRLKGEYESSFAPVYLAPEIRGAKSLRLVAEGWF